MAWLKEETLMSTLLQNHLHIQLISTSRLIYLTVVVTTTSLLALVLILVCYMLYRRRATQRLLERA
jgi:hypothetical protein